MSGAVSITDDARHVIFGTGPLGLAVMRRLVTAGKRVKMINRSGRSEDTGGVEVVAADATDPAACRRVCEDAAVVFHFASGSYGRWPQTLPPIMEGIIQGAATAGAKLVYGDNLYMYGPVNEPLTEDLPYRPVGPNTAVRASLAAALMEAHANGKVRAVIGRASDFYGPHVHLSTVGDSVFDRALKGKPARVLGDPEAPHTYTYIDDFASGLIMLGSRADALGQIWHVPSAETLTTRGFVDVVFQQLGRRARLRSTPRLVVNVLALLSPTLKAVREVLYQSERPWIVDHSKFAAAFGSTPTPHGQAIAETLTWFRQRQELP